MVQLVFVHGVATRSGPTLVRAVENRNTLFREIAFAGMDVNILSPTWGDAVPSNNPKVFGTDEKRSDEHTSELQSLMRISYAVSCLKKKTKNQQIPHTHAHHTPQRRQ